MQRITINKIIKKKNVIPIICLTAYSKTITKIADKYCDIILVGDSLGMVLYGMKTTKEVKIDTMILHAKAVKNSAKKSLVVLGLSAWNIGQLDGEIEIGGWNLSEINLDLHFTESYLWSGYISFAKLGTYYFRTISNVNRIIYSDMGKLTIVHSIEIPLINPPSKNTSQQKL